MTNLVAYHSSMSSIQERVVSMINRPIVASSDNRSFNGNLFGHKSIANECQSTGSS